MAENAPRRSASTFEDLLHLPAGVIAEVIGGEVVERASPAFEHSASQRALGERLGPFARRPGRGGPGGWWIGTEVEVAYEAHEVYRHDLAGWRRERVPEAPTGRPITIPPDWACEILSPSNWANGTVLKFRTLQRNAVPFYWIVDLERDVLTVYRLREAEYAAAAVAQPGETARLPPFDAIALEVAVLFGHDPVDE